MNLIATMIPSGEGKNRRFRRLMDAVAKDQRETVIKHSRLFQGPGKKQGFSLVEVVLAIGVISFAFLSVLGLLPLGMTTFKQSMETTVSSQIAQRVLNEAVQTDFDLLIDNSHLLRDTNGNVSPAKFTFLAPSVASAANGSTWRYFDDQGTELASTNAAKATYHVLTRINPQVPLPGAETSGDLKGLAQVTVQVVKNPANRSIPLTTHDPSDYTQPLRNMVDPTKGFPTYTAASLVPRNK